MVNRKASSIVEVHGPTLTARQELLPDTEWVRVVDHYNPVELDLFLDQQGCRDVRIFQDFFWLPLNSQRTTIFAPVWLNVFCDFNYGAPVLTDHVETVDCFNFMMYKPRLLRQLIIAEILKRGLVTDSYTYSGTNDVGADIKPRYFGSARQTVYNNVKDYNDFLRDHVFDRSAVALITETIEPEWHDNMTFTEKTLWAMLSLNFPIWLGGRCQADLWKAVGFDVFDDVVNHDYQYLSDPMERIHCALDTNDRLLRDLAHVGSLRKQMNDRLRQNRQLVFDQTIKRYTNSLTCNLDNDLLKKI